MVRIRDIPGRCSHLLHICTRDREAWPSGNKVCVWPWKGTKNLRSAKMCLRLPTHKTPGLLGFMGKQQWGRKCSLPWASAEFSLPFGLVLLFCLSSPPAFPLPHPSLDSLSYPLPVRGRALAAPGSCLIFEPYFLLFPIILWSKLIVFQ